MPSARFLLLALRLGLFQAGLGMLAVLTLGIFNRLLIEEFSVPAALTALAIGAQQLVAFTRVWFGRQSDRMPEGSLRRTPWILGGAAAFCTLFWVAGRLVLWIAEASSAGDTGLVVQRGLLLTLVFLLYGTAVSASSTPFAALLIDVTTERQRPQLVSIVWTMLTMGIVAGAILSSRFLGSACASEQLDLVIQGVERLIVVAPVLIFSLVLISIIGVERHHSSRDGRDGGSQELSIRQTIQVIRADRQVGYFFGVLCLFTFSLFLQEAVMEPYGGSIFGMSVCQTTRLNAIWGIGTLVGIASTGFLITPRIGAQRTALLGAGLSAFFLLLIVLAGTTESSALFRLSLGLFGFGAGVSTNACLTLMLGLTSPLLAGTFIGIWGVAQAYSRGIATVAGGSVLSGAGLIWGSETSFGAYASVFVLQALGLLISGFLLLRVDTSLFKERIERTLGSLVAHELD